MWEWCSWFKDLPRPRPRGKESPGLEGEPLAGQQECVWANVSRCALLSALEQPRVTKTVSILFTQTPTPAATLHHREVAVPAGFTPCLPSAGVRAASAEEHASVCLRMPTHHHHRVFIRAQFLGRVLSVPAARSQQTASVCDLLVETGRGEVS